MRRWPKRSVETAAMRLTGMPRRAHALATLNGAPPGVAVIAPSGATTRSTSASPTVAITALDRATGDLDVDAGEIRSVL